MTSKISRLFSPFFFLSLLSFILTDHSYASEWWHGIQDQLGTIHSDIVATRNKIEAAHKKRNLTDRVYGEKIESLNEDLTKRLREFLVRLPDIAGGSEMRKQKIEGFANDLRKTLLDDSHPSYTTDFNLLSERLMNLMSFKDRVSEIFQTIP